jgi:hypothetical protein
MEDFMCYNKAKRTKEFDEKMKEIPHFKQHPQMIPFVGKFWKSSENGLLIIAQNPYIYDIPIFYENIVHQILDDWYTTSIFDIENKVIRDKIKKSTELIKNIEDYSIVGDSPIPPSQRLYNNIIQAIIEKNIVGKNNENILSYIAFVDFFQRPHFNEDFNANEQDIIIANETLKEIIKIINPKYIFFVSDGAYNALDKKMFNENILIGHSCHPSKNHWYNYGKDVFQKFIIENKIL